MDNAEGSSSSLTELSSMQESILVGTLLGDGCLAKHGYHHRLHIKHKAEHKALAELKYRAFRELISMPMHAFDQRLGERRYPCVQFASRTSPVFSQWHHRFYCGGRKIVPQNIARYLSPLALAVWLMDDGAADHAGVTFQTHGFSHAGVARLITALSKVFGLAASPRLNKGRLIVYVSAAENRRLRTLVEPLVIPELRYKLMPHRTRTP